MGGWPRDVGGKLVPWQIPPWHWMGGERLLETSPDGDMGGIEVAGEEQGGLGGLLSLMEPFAF